MFNFTTPTVIFFPPSEEKKLGLIRNFNVQMKRTKLKSRVKHSTLPPMMTFKRLVKTLVKNINATFSETLNTPTCFKHNLSVEISETTTIVRITAGLKKVLRN